MEETPIAAPQRQAPHHEIAKKAAQLLGTLIDGNGLTASHVRLARQEVGIYEIPGLITATIKPDIAHNQLKGKIPRGEMAASKNDVFNKAEGLTRNIAEEKPVQEEIEDDLQRRPGLGFGMEPQRMALHHAKKEFSVVDKCLKCNGAAMQECIVCHASGKVPCPPCQGMGTLQHSDGTQAPCHACQGTRFIVCQACRGTRTVPCGECDQSGYWTHVYQVSWRAEIFFEADLRTLPREAVDIVNLLGIKKMDEHAEVIPGITEMREGRIVIPLTAHLPVAQAEFSLEGKACPAIVAGLQGRIMEIGTILDPLVKPGINALFKLSKGPLAAEALMESACRYRLVREVLAGLSHHNRNKVYKRIVARYPLVLSEKYAKAAVRYADIALLAVSEGPRTRGLIAGLALTGALAVGYCLTPLQNHVHDMLQTRGWARHTAVADLSVWIVGYAMAVLTIKAAAARALKKFLPPESGQKDRGLPVAGRQGLWALPASFIIWVAVAEHDRILSLLKTLTGS